MPTTCFSRPAFKSRVVPVIVLQDPAHAVPLAHALLEGGIDVMEITLRSDAALKSIEAVAKIASPSDFFVMARKLPVEGYLEILPRCWWWGVVI